MSGESVNCIVVLVSFQFKCNYNYWNVSTPHGHGYDDYNFSAATDLINVPGKMHFLCASASATERKPSGKSLTNCYCELLAGCKRQTRCTHKYSERDAAYARRPNYYKLAAAVAVAVRVEQKYAFSGRFDQSPQLTAKMYLLCVINGFHTSDSVLSQDQSTRLT